MAQRAQISTKTVLNDLKNPNKRRTLERYTKMDRVTPRCTPIRLSGSTARLDDFIYLRAGVKDVVRKSDALELLKLSGFADDASWEMALRRLGLQEDPKPSDLKLVAAEDEREVTEAPQLTFPFRPTASSAFSGAVMEKKNGFTTPVRPESKAETPQVPPAPRMERDKEPGFAKGTEGFHRFFDALSSYSRDHGTYRNALPGEYGHFWSAISTFERISPLFNPDPKPEDVERLLNFGTPAARSEPPLTVTESADRDAHSWQQNTPTPAPRNMGRRRIIAEDEDKDEEEEDADERGIPEADHPDRTPGEKTARDETFITMFYGSFINSISGTMFQLPAWKAYGFGPSRESFWFAHGTKYAVNAAIDGIVSRAPSEPMLLMAEFKDRHDQPYMYQMGFEFASIISEKYAAGGEDPFFHGRRYELGIYQRGTVLGIIIAEYGATWVKYIQDGDNTVIPSRGGLKEEDMLILHQVHITRLGDKPGLTLHSAFVGSVLQKDFQKVRPGR
ncbi:hypothetical protein V500_04893 [Pseudogymnoascus sp. VKM F-4518 (FW-2643)]|nr:hypothetical protein V500_04893 [Pseudogymnoascus sp. VKM F-4518 (FW-2643)]